MPASSHTDVAPDSWVIAFIGLGANLGDAQSAVRGAAQQLSETPGIAQLDLSPLYRSTPVDAAGPDYINAVARLRTRLDAHALLDTLQSIEQAYGRLRPYRNAPRSLDLDLLLYADACIDSPRLTVPHPRMHLRAFVLKPLSDLVPELRLLGTPLPVLLQKCADQAIQRI